MATPKEVLERKIKADREEWSRLKRRALELSDSELVNLAESTINSGLYNKSTSGDRDYAKNAVGVIDWYYRNGYLTDNQRKNLAVFVSHIHMPASNSNPDNTLVRLEEAIRQVQSGESTVVRVTSRTLVYKDEEDTVVRIGPRRESVL